MIVEFADPATLVSNLKAALLAASEDVTRAHLNCIRVEFRKNCARFVSTNGHWMWLNETPGVHCDGEAAVQISRDDAKRLIKAVDTSRKMKVATVTLDTGAATVCQSGNVTSFKNVVATFPPYAEVVPNDVGTDRVLVVLAADYLGDVFAAFRALHKDPGVTIETGLDENAPVVLTSEKCPDALAVVMPRRDAGPKGGSDALRGRYRKVPEKAKSVAT